MYFRVSIFSFLGANVNLSLPFLSKNVSHHFKRYFASFVCGHVNKSRIRVNISYALLSIYRTNTFEWELFSNGANWCKRERSQCILFITDVQLWVYETNSKWKVSLVINKIFDPHVRLSLGLAWFQSISSLDYMHIIQLKAN